MPVPAFVCARVLERVRDALQHPAWPLRPGLYEVRFLLDDGYSSRAKSARFWIVKRAA